MPDSGLWQQKSPVQVVEAYLQAWNDHSGQAVVRTFADGGTYVDPTLPGPVASDDLEGYVDALVEAFPDLRFETDGIIADGDRVVVQWRMTGTNTGPLPGMPAPTGGTSNLPGLDVITVGSAGILSVVGYFDQLTFLGQLGVEVQVAPPHG
jgi:steroid delta-isomerase-like uncharacterized protein